MGQQVGKEESDSKRSLREAVEEKQWGRAVLLLRHHHYPPPHRGHVVQAAAKEAPPWMVSKFLPHCPDQYLHAVLDRLLSRHLWSDIDVMHSLRGAEKNGGWGLPEGGADDWAMACHVVPHCADRQLDTVLTFLTSRGLWQAVGETLRRGVVSEARHSQVVSDASKLANVACFQRYIMPHCEGDDRLAALSNLVERNLPLVEIVVSGMVTSALKKWVLTDTSDSGEANTGNRADTFGSGKAVIGNRADTIDSSEAVTGNRADTINSSEAVTGNRADTIDSGEAVTGNRADTFNSSEAVTGNRADTIDSGEAVTGNGADTIDSGEAVIGNRADTIDSGEAVTGNRADTIDSGEAVTGNRADTIDSGEAVIGNRADTIDSGEAVTGNRADTFNSSEAVTGNSSTADTFDGGEAVTGNRANTFDSGEAVTGNRADTIGIGRAVTGNKAETIDSYEAAIGNSKDTNRSSTHTDGNNTATTGNILETTGNNAFTTGNCPATPGKILETTGNSTYTPCNKMDTAGHSRNNNGNSIDNTNTFGNIPDTTDNSTNNTATTSKNIPNVDNSAPNVGKNIPNADNNAPNVGKNIPNADNNAPNVGKNIPNADNNAPNVGKNIPNADNNAPNVGKNIPNADNSAPNVSNKTHTTDNSTSVTGNDTDITRTSLRRMIGSCRVDLLYTIRLFSDAKRSSASTIARLAKELDLADDLCEVLYTSALHRLCVMLCSDVTVSTKDEKPLGDGMRQLYDAINACVRKDCKYRDVDGASSYRFLKMKQVTASLPPGIRKTGSNLSFLYFLENFNMYYTSRRGKPDDDILLTMFAVTPLFSELQSVALSVMLRHKRWDVISHASLSRAWEQDRRHLLQTAVKQRQWGVVKRWSDHTLYDDQRVWLLNQALKDKQWDVVLLLADYGLTDIQLMRVHYRLAKHADWDVVLAMFERGGDVAEVRVLLSKELAEMRSRSRSGKVEHTDASAKLEDDLAERHLQLIAFEKTMNKRKNVSQAITDCDWSLLLFSLIRSFSRSQLRLALKAAMKKKAWRTVIQLVRLGMDTVQRDALFSKMVRRRRWDVCRALLEQGLSVQLCLDALPHLMERNQWTLVARVMEHEVGDDVRQDVMRRAWERREGSVVWLCIKSLPTPLSVEEREALFQRAFSCQLWQVVKPLVEAKDEAGVRHRDTALLEAIVQHQWDVVDHCQRHHADINMKDGDGHTPLQRAAMKRDWEGVEELVVRDGDPNLLDKEGYSVMHRATNQRQWDTVRLLIQFHGDIHQPANPRTARASRIHVNRTPLQMLIVARQGELIEHTLMWSPRQSRGVSVGGETALHALCLSGWHPNLQYVLARGVDPLALTKNGHSVLMYAVLTKDCPERMVAECIRLGFGSHQPSLTVWREEDFAKALIQATLYPKYVPTLITSPFLFSVLRGLPVVTQMLYESGSCSCTELRWLFFKLSEVVDQDTEETKRRLPGWRFANYLQMMDRIQAALPQLRRMATTPRTLMSACRLVVSLSLDVRGKRQRDVEQLGVLEYYEDYLLFSDLAHPHYGKFIAW